MATKTLAQKLYIRPGYTVALLNAPQGTAELLAPLPDDVKIVTAIKMPVDLVLSFVKSAAELEKSVADLKEALSDDIVLWFAYPKLSSKVKSDLTRDQGWRTLFDMGFQGVASVAINDTWTGIRFKRAQVTSEEDSIAKQYTGDRAKLLPLYEKLATTILSLGPDVETVPRQSYVAFTRGKQFALIRPTRERLDLALKMPTDLLNAP